MFLCSYDSGMLLNRHSCFLFVVKFVFLVDFKHIANTQNKMSSLPVMTMVSAVVIFYFGEFQTHKICGVGMANLAKKERSKMERPDVFVTLAYHNVR